MSNPIFLYADVELETLEYKRVQWKKYLALLEEQIDILNSSLGSYTEPLDVVDAFLEQRMIEEMKNEIELLRTQHQWTKLETQICDAYYQVLQSCSDPKSLKKAVKICSTLKTRGEILQFWQSQMPTSL
jgi:hypothetical protein